MKKVLYLSVGCVLALTSCVEFDFDANREALIKENAENIFGMIDPKQDWSCIKSGSITVTADAPLSNITKVQILTESPFLNDDVRILAEAKVTNGQTVTINYDAPIMNERLVAACLDDKGHYFIKGFDINENEVGFAYSFKAGARSRTRAGNTAPDLSNISMDFSNSYPSYNAGRAKRASQGLAAVQAWKDKGWENERLWLPTGSINDGWTIANNTIYRDADPLIADEKKELEDIFKASLYRTDEKGKKKDNLQLIREGNAVKFYGSHLIADGKAPITLIPVQLASKDAKNCAIYYYYFKPSDVTASGLSEAEYIKRLPKFKAVDLGAERSAFSAKTGVSTNANDENFLRLHEYLLPNYGDASLYMLTPTSVVAQGFTPKNQFYRIRCTDKNVYMTYTSDGNIVYLKSKYDDKSDIIGDQVFQVFANGKGQILLFNVGSQQFVRFINKTTFPQFYSEIDEFQKFHFNLCDKSNMPLSENAAWTNIHLLTFDNTCILKTIDGNNVGLDANNKKDRVYVQWTFEEYTPSKPLDKISDYGFNFWPTTPPSPSPLFEKGTMIGFLIRKGNDTDLNDSKLTHNTNGCLYGYGELNREVNTFGEFSNAISLHSMELNDPRIAMFNANLKTYLCFEEGPDCQFSDDIIELGGFSIEAANANVQSSTPSIGTMTYNVESVSNISANSSSGTYLFDDMEEIPGLAYTMCFEDRPETADYDLNDLVIRCVRDEYEHDVIQISIVAIGATDNLFIEGIDGKPLEGEKDLMAQEVHEYYRVGNRTGEERFVNTLEGKTLIIPINSWYKMNSDISLPQFMSKIVLRNASTGMRIKAPVKGKEPSALIIPGDFNYPKEYHSILEAYKDFKSWAQNVNVYQDWLKFEEDGEVYTNPFGKR